jgi:hypothetical protein
MQRSAADLTMLAAGNPESDYPYAGVPWYSVPFGRDGILTAMQYLWVDPGMARGVLRFLAETQATQANAAQDAEPGKIVHEMRKGELAALGEIPSGATTGPSTRLRSSWSSRANTTSAPGMKRSCTRSGPASSARSPGSTSTATSTATASSSTSARAAMGW